MKNIILVTLICFLTTMLFAQNIDVNIITEPRCDIPNNKHIIDILVQKGNTPNDVNLSTQNYRFSYNTLALSNPVILSNNSDLNFGNPVNSNNGNNTSIFKNPSLIGSTLGEISLNIDLEEDTDGYYLSTVSSTYICSIQFDIVDGTESINIDWHEKIQHPATLIASKNNNQETIVVQEFDDTKVNSCANCAGDCIEFDMNIKLVLEGPYNKDTNEYSATLSSKGLLPGQTPDNPLVSPTPQGQPYNAAPWNYTGTEGANFTDAQYDNTDIDWVLVSLRTSPSKDAEIFKTAGILNVNGNVKFVKNTYLSNIINPLYIVVEHRNHLSVMSHMPVSFAGNVLSYDFSAQDSYRNPSKYGQILLNNGKWAAIAGNGETGTASTTDRDDIKGNDKFPWVDFNGNFDQYLVSDYNLDADVNGADKAIWIDNNGKSCIVNQ